jgi:hypothetical protein
MSWYISDEHHDGRGKKRAIAWRCSYSRRLEVRHCGHPTANYPYWIKIDGQDRPDLGTHRLLAMAQDTALLELTRLEAVQEVPA